MQTPKTSMLERLRGKTFILGIGAQKAGTTWLYSYLHSRPDVYMSPIKELHYFDQLYRPDLCAHLSRPYNVRLARKLLQLQPDETVAGRQDIIDLLDRARMSYDNNAYLEFFATRAPAEARMIGEMTPSYSLIGSGGYGAIRAMFESVNIPLKIVYLLRDPVDRFYSALRMLERTNKSFSVERDYGAYLENPRFYERGLYQVTLRNLRANFATSDVFVGFYENLFSHAEVERVCRFLGIDYSLKADLASRINQSPGAPISDEMRAAAQQRFADVYAYCRGEFADRLPATWNCP